MAINWNDTNSPEEFPTDIAGLWRVPQGTRGGMFSVHKNLSAVKAEVSRNSYYKGGWKIYELSDGQWSEIYEIPAGTDHYEHPLWKNGAAPKGKQTVSDEAVQAAIASIMRTEA